MLVFGRCGFARLLQKGECRQLGFQEGYLQTAVAMFILAHPALADAYWSMVEERPKAWTGEGCLRPLLIRLEVRMGCL